jgi:hypothetical protein
MERHASAKANHTRSRRHTTTWSVRPTLISIFLTTGEHREVAGSRMKKSSARQFTRYVRPPPDYNSLAHTTYSKPPCSAVPCVPLALPTTARLDLALPPVSVTRCLTLGPASHKLPSPTRHAVIRRALLNACRAYYICMQVRCAVPISSI